MAKWAEKPWINLRLELDASEVEALLIRLRRVASMIKTDAVFIRIKRVADIIKSDAVCKSRPTVRDKANELLALIDLLESKFDE